MSSNPSGPTPDGDFAPTCTVIGGPNGSGKSTIYKFLSPKGEFVNADLIGRLITPRQKQSVDQSAAWATLHRLLELREEGRDFVFETTLSGHQLVALMERARKAGYQVGLVFVALADVELNVKRVAERVSKGGHDIPDAIIRRRYPKSFANLAKAIKVSHGCLIYDNSSARTQLVARINGTSLEVNNLDPFQTHHALIAAAVAEALGVEADAVFRDLKTT